MIQLGEGNSLEVLAKLIDAGISWDYCITSPPYYSQIDYGHADQIGLEPTSQAYIEAVAGVFARVYQGMSDGGVLCLNIQDTINGYSTVRAGGRRQAEVSFRRKPEPGYRSSEPLEIPSRLVQRLRQQGWILIERLIWDKGYSSQPKRGCRSGSTFEDVLVLGKSRYSRPRFYINPGALSILREPPVKSHSKTHPCPMPMGLVTQLLIRANRTAGTVLDPFCGSGTVLWEAHGYGYDAIGIDLDIHNAQMLRTELGSELLRGIHRYAN